MDHVRVFAAVVNLLLSLLAVICIQYLAAGRKKTLFRYLLLLAAAHIVYDLRTFLFFYIDVNIERVFASHASLAYPLFWLLPKAITWCRRACLLKISIVMHGRELPGHLWHWLLLLGGLLLAFFAAWLVLPALDHQAERVDAIFRIGLGGLETLAMLVVLGDARGLADARQRTAWRTFAGMSLGGTLFYFLYLLFGRHPGDSLALRLVFDFAFRIYINAALLAWLWCFLRPWLHREAMPEPAGPTAADFGPYGLSERERQIASMMLQGESNRAIADRLFVSEHTVKNAITAIYAKLGVANRKELFHRFLSGRGNP